MLSRPATKLTLTADDILAYEHRKVIREASKAAELESSQTSDQSNQSTVGTGNSLREEITPAAQTTRAARVKMSREQRIGVGSSRG